MKARGVLLVLTTAAAVFLLVAHVPWHADASVRKAAAIAATTLVLWISEIAPLGVVGLAIPVAATLAGVMPWGEAVAPLGDSIIFLNLGAFLLARSLDKFGAFDWMLSGRLWARVRSGPPIVLIFAVLVVSGIMSMAQNNTAVTAMLLPIVASVARHSAHPASVMMALSLGATLGGMATPIGTAPNFLGYGEIKKLDSAMTFIGWLRVGLPVWIGGVLLAAGLLHLANRWLPVRRGERVSPSPGWILLAAATDVGPAAPVRSDVWKLPPDVVARGRRWSLIAIAAAATLWLASGLVINLTGAGSSTRTWVESNLPESLVPIAVACMLFVIRISPDGQTVLNRHDFQAIDWDTLFLFAGGLTLGRMLKTSGSADALADALVRAEWSPLLLIVGLAAVTVLLSELTSNTATAALIVPLAIGVAPSVGFEPTHVVWIATLCASLGFALPVSTPPNALIYGTGLIPLRWMACVGIVVDVVLMFWVIGCVVALG